VERFAFASLFTLPSSSKDVTLLAVLLFNNASLSIEEAKVRGAFGSSGGGRK
jgi:hypothetical protein